MLDIGSWEFLLIIMLGIVVIGPKELPGVVRSVGLWVRRAKDLAREFQGGLEEIARETEIDKFKNNLESELGDANSIGREIADAVDPDGDVALGQLRLVKGLERRLLPVVLLVEQDGFEHVAPRVVVGSFIVVA